MIIFGSKLLGDWETSSLLFQTITGDILFKWTKRLNAQIRNKSFPYYARTISCYFWVQPYKQKSLIRTSFYLLCKHSPLRKFSVEFMALMWGNDDYLYLIFNCFLQDFKIYYIANNYAYTYTCVIWNVLFCHRQLKLSDSFT